MKIFQICFQCGKESPPHEVGVESEKFQFCPYCGAAYVQPGKGGVASHSMSRVEMSPDEERASIKRVHDALHEAMYTKPGGG